MCPNRHHQTLTSCTVHITYNSETEEKKSFCRQKSVHTCRIQSSHTYLAMYAQTNVGLLCCVGSGSSVTVAFRRQTGLAHWNAGDYVLRFESCSPQGGQSDGRRWQSVTTPQGPVALRSSCCGPKAFTGHCNTASISAQASETGDMSYRPPAHRSSRSGP